MSLKQRFNIWLDKNFPTNAVEKKEGKASGGKQKTQAADLFRETFTIKEWRDAVDVAEDVEFPDRIELARLFKDLVDDDAIFQCMQIRTSRSVKGTMAIKNESGEDATNVTDVFFKPDGNPQKWFRDWIKLQVSAKYYGARLLQFGDIVDGVFEYVKGVDYQNVIPEKGKIIINTDYGIWGNDENLIDFTKPLVSKWCYLVDDGDPRSLGLLNKCAAFYIWKNDSYGNWSMFQELYGVDTKVGKTDITDPNRRDAMDAALGNSTGASYITVGLDDEVEFIASKVSDSYETFKQPIKTYDQAINKIILGQTSLSEEKSFVGSAEIQEEAGNDIILMDKIDIADNFEKQLVPFMQMHGVLPEGDLYLVWDMSEKVDMATMAEIVSKLSVNYNIDADEISKRFNIDIENKEPDNDIIETANNVYKSIVNGKNSGRNI